MIHFTNLLYKRLNISDLYRLMSFYKNWYNQKGTPHIKKKERDFV